MTDGSGQDREEPEAGGRHIRIFLSSPGDVAAERARAEAVVRVLADELAGRATLKLIRWENDYYSSADDFQGQIARPSECDLVVCILWSRLGSELPPDRYARPDGTPYASGTEFEFEDARSAALDRGMPDILTYRRKGVPQIAADDEEALRQWHLVKVFWERWFRTDAGHFIAAYHSFTDTDDFAAQLERHLRLWLKEQGLFGQVVWPPEKGSPFRGLEAFEAEHALVFFGRRRAVAQVLAGLEQAAARGCAWLLAIGMSGSGKSSLMRAGVVPRLLQPSAVDGADGWRACVVRADDGLAGLAAVLFEALPELAAGDLATPDALAEHLAESGPSVLAAPIRAALTRAGALDAAAGYDRRRALHLLLVVDQLESLFGLATDERDRLVAVWDALARSGVVWVAATLRSDLYSVYQSHAGLMALKRDGAHFDLLPPDPVAVAEIIRGPAAAAGLAFETDPETGEHLDAKLEAAARREGVLPLLEFTLDELWKRREALEADRGQQEAVLTFGAYDELGGLEGAIGARAEAAFQAMSLPDQQRSAALARVLRALVTVNPGAEGTLTARPADLAHFPSDAPERTVVEALAAPDARLLVLSGEDGEAREPKVRVAHEALLTHWARAAGQLESDRQDLALRAQLDQEAARWASAAPDDRAALLLPPGLRLTEAEDLANRRGDELQEGTCAYVAASSRAHAEAAAAERAAERYRLALEQGRARRFRRLAMVAAAAALVSVAAGIYAVVQQRAAEVQRQEAENQALLAEAQGELAKIHQTRAELIAEEAEVAREEAERNFEIAVGAANSLIYDFILGLRNQAGVRAEDLRAIVGVAETALTKLLAVHTDDPRLQGGQADTLLALSTLYLSVGDADAAEDAVRRAEVTVRELVGTDPEDPVWRHGLASTLIQLGQVRSSQGDQQSAIEVFVEALEIARDLSAQEPDVAEWQRDIGLVLAVLGETLSAQGDTSGALAAYNEALEIRRRLAAREPDNQILVHDLVGILDKLSDIQTLLGKSDEALALSSEALEGMRSLATSVPNNTLWQDEFAVILNRNGNLLVLRQDIDAALPLFEEALGVARRLVDLDPDNANWQFTLSDSLLGAGNCHNQQGDLAEAMEVYAESLEIRRALVALDSSQSAWRGALAASLASVGDIAIELGDLAGAIAAYDQARDLLSELAEAEPSNTKWRFNLGIDLQRLGDLLLLQGDPEGAGAAYVDSVSALRDLVELNPSATTWQRELGVSIAYLADALIDQGQPAEAFAQYREAETIFRQLAEVDPENLRWQRDLARALERIGDVLSEHSDASDTRAAYEEALRIWERVTARDPGNVEWHLRLAWLSVILADLYGVGDPRMVDMLEQALEAWRVAVSLEPDNAEWRANLALTYYELAQAEVAPASNLAEAIAILRDLDDQGLLSLPRQPWIAVFENELAQLTEATD